MLTSKAIRLVALASELSSSTPSFHLVKGPGNGDRATEAFMQRLRELAEVTFGAPYHERAICGDNKLTVDFYFPDEASIVEVALGLQNPTTEFEKDILKALMAREAGHAVTRLVFIARAGGKRKCEQPGRTAMRDWARDKHGLVIEVHDLPGERRKRRRQK